VIRICQKCFTCNWPGIYLAGKTAWSGHLQAFCAEFGKTAILVPPYSDLYVATVPDKGRKDTLRTLILKVGFNATRDAITSIIKKMWAIGCSVPLPG
jgi:hypothetical protein